MAKLLIGIASDEAVEMMQAVAKSRSKDGMTGVSTDRARALADAVVSVDGPKIREDQTRQIVAWMRENSILPEDEVPFDPEEIAQQIERRFLT
jgi:hypothetical protein